MRSEPNGQSGEPGAQRVAQLTPTRKRPQASRCSPVRAALAASLLYGGVAAAQGNSHTQLRRFIDRQVGGIEKLMVPAHDADLPVTRNTPWDRFLAGDNCALTPAQRRGARLFFTAARNGGAGCYTCHSGPMLLSGQGNP
jgi:hypothetical protein